MGMQPKAGGKLHLRLNTGTRPIVNKYRKGKLKRTLKREFKRAVHLSNGNAGVLRRAQGGQKPPVEQKGKSSLDLDFQYEYRP